MGRVISILFTHVLFSGLYGVGAWYLAAKRDSEPKYKKAFGVCIILFTISTITHILWNLTANFFAENKVSPDHPIIILSILILVFTPILIVILRDLLGGIFNFRTFLSTLPEPIQPDVVSIPEKKYPILQQPPPQSPNPPQQSPPPPQQTPQQQRF